MSQDNWPPEKNFDERCMKELDFLLQVSLYYTSWGNFDRYNNYIASIIRLFRIFCKRQRTVFYTSTHKNQKKMKLLYIKAQVNCPNYWERITQQRVSPASLSRASDWQRLSVDVFLQMRMGLHQLCMPN